ncbi:MAG: transcription antitermination factor NusB [Isosphaeraceae bacterium]
MTRRSRGREVALQVLYQVEQNAGMPAREIEQFIKRRLLGEPKLVEFTRELIAGVREHQPRIDEMIQGVAENWRLDRMAAIDRNILRLGAYEVLYRGEVPPKVAINEALELAKRYSTAQSSRFVNGILDRVLQIRDADTPSSDATATEDAAEAVSPDDASETRPPDSGADAGAERTSPDE